jgi:Spy/CpxP family protein refolding chaperone
MERAFGAFGDHGKWWNNPKIIEKLKLTDDQRKAMDAILLDHREKLIDMRGNVEKAELAMEPLVQADQPNETAILAQIDKVAQARADLEKANARFLLALRAKLTPEQWKALQELRAERHDGQERRMWQQRGPGSGPGGKQGPGPDSGPGASPAGGPPPNGPQAAPGEGPQGL